MAKKKAKKKQQAEEKTQEAAEQQAEQAGEEQASNQPAQEAGEQQPAPKKKRGGCEKVRELVALNPAITVDEVMEALEQEGFTLTRSTVEVVHLDSRKMYEKLAELGKL